MTNTTKKTAKPTNLRELSLYSAGIQAGMRNVWLAQARSEKGAMRALKVRHAREAHWTYLARLREAQQATLGLAVGYYVPASLRAPIDCGMQVAAQAAA